MSMSLIHEKLYKSENISKVDFKKYVIELVNEIRYSYPDKKDRVIFVTHCDDLLIDLGKAIPCGLLLNELITNSVKYAFEGKEGKGQVNLDITRANDRIYLKYADNGIGFNVVESSTNTESLGMILIESLIEQLDAKGGYDDNTGKSFSIRFSAN
jgi:two-component sensor histidine kinase